MALSVLSQSKNMSLDDGTREESQLTYYSGNKKGPPISAGPVVGYLTNRLFAGALELVGEFLHATGGIDETLFTGVSRVGVHGHVAHDHEILFPINLLLTGRLHGGLGQETLARCDVEEAEII